MQIINAGQGPRILSNGTEIAPGQVATIADDVWAKMRERKVVAHWLAIGDLKEMAPPPPPAAPVAPASPVTVEKPAKARAVKPDEKAAS